MGFFTSVEFALVDAVGLAAINRREAVFGVAFAVTTDSAGVTSDGLTDFVISQAVVSVQETPCTRENTRLVRSRGKQCVQFGSFIGRQIDNVLLSSWHDGLQNISEYH
ncbi:hypothetical protein HLRTI_001054 [Halorhabdus tiamatea SARL4B]|uniref:Uncharacterized protein n=1 Tax=Halorhabdus tiamatea SARL4B TaxID=1033806 RepID=U2F9P9_9EURY|nr:hypothetical protein HLRTI_001054 [Halorhabdus tiamatea SARL4B]